MSQQINLLKPKARSVSVVVWALAAVAVVLLALLGYLQVLVAENARLREVAGAGEQKLVQIKNSIQSLQKRTDAQGDAATLKAEVAALRSRAEAVNQLAKEVKSGNLGSPDGFARYFNALGSVSEPGLWVTNVAVTRGGTAVSVNGRALRNEAVMQYARRLNDALGPYEVHFNSLELAPESIVKPGSTGGPALPVVSFKLS